MKNNLLNDEALSAYADYERQIYIKHLEIGCYLVMFLMPAGVILDWFVYHQLVVTFLELRLICAGLAALFLLSLRTSLKQNAHQALSLAIAVLPSFFICLMIYFSGDVGSPYYAGLTLVLPLSIAR